MSYLLDTNAAIALIKREPALVRARFQEAKSAHASVYVSSIGHFELWYGVALSEKKEDNAANIRALMAAGLKQLPFDFDDARIAGEERARLKLLGTPIGPYDLLLAAQALRSNLTLVTANEREFRRVRGLKIENWATSRPSRRY